MATDSRLRKQFVGSLQRDGAKLEQVTLTVIDRPIDDRHRNWVTAVKLETETRNSTTTVADDAELSIVVEASKLYMMRAFVVFSTQAVPDFKFEIDGPASPTTVTIHGHYNGVGSPTDTNFIDNAFNTSYSALGSGAGQGIVGFDVLLENGTNAGKVTLQWAQNTSDAGDTSVLAGSYIEVITVT
jgi:hypothetical protein